MSSLVLAPTAVTDDATYGATPWTNPDGFRVKNYGEATAVVPPGGSTHFARASFDCSALPAGVTLTGVKVAWRVSDGPGPPNDDGSPGDASVRLAPAGGSPAGDDKARQDQPYPPAYSVREFGGDGDLWGAGLDADAVRAGGLDALFAARWRRNPSAPAYPDGPAKVRGDEATLTLYYA